ncbi:MAG TPA: carboxypeptidase-like regulatory domain-containing protein [Kiritimatiellia bacterium]|nr:carboxypeptidase-like regulatory domain-containing protein [Kiritimatiellia bacterium]HMP35671.1 carboxypeptidase-like regulatory domain-containing protein [Kiritimatiellia bacterium]
MFRSCVLLPFALLLALGVMPSVSAEPGGGIEGEVRNLDNFPAYRATVFATAREGGWKGWATTDETGWFRLGGMPDGAYDLMVVYANHPRILYDQVMVTNGAVTGDLLLTPGLLSACCTVLGPEGAPLAGALVQWRPHDPGPNDELVVAVLTDAEGRACASNLGAGTYELQVNSPGRIYRRTSVVVPVDTQEGLYIALGGTGSVAGVVLDRNNQPISAATVQAVRTDAVGSLLAIGSTDDLGRYTLRHLPDGPIEVMARTGDQLSPWIAPEGEDEVILTTSARGATITGQVLRDRAELLVDSVQVEHRWGAITPAVALVDSNGMFRITRLPAGPYRLTTLSANRRHRQTVELGHGKKVEVVMDLRSAPLPPPVPPSSP